MDLLLDPHNLVRNICRPLGVALLLHRNNRRRTAQSHFSLAVHSHHLDSVASNTRPHYKSSRLE
jgi:hypothetical protein